MKSLRNILASLVAVALAPVLSHGQAPAAGKAVPSPGKAIYETAMSHVDAGGEMLVFLNTDGATKRIVKMGLDLMKAFGENNPDLAETQAFVNRLDAYLGKIGLHGIDSFAMSSRKRGDGMFDIKSFVGHKPGGTLWKLYGEKPRKLSLLGYAAADADLVFDLTLEPAIAWQLVREGVREVGGAEADQAFTAELAKMKTENKVDIEDLMKSAGNEMMLSLKMPAKSSAPPAGMMDAMPRFVVALAVPDDKILNTALEQTKAMRGEAAPVVKGDLKIYAMTPPALGPGPVLVSRKGLLMLASSAELADAAIAASASGKNITTNPEVVKYLPAGAEACNGFSFTSTGLMQGIADLSGGMMEGPEATLQKELMELLGAGTQVAVTWCDAGGMRSHTVSKADGRVMLLAAPLGVMAGVAMPAFSHAREAAQGNSCKANLRQIESAVEMFKLDHPDKEPAMSDLESYLNGGSLECPQGGTYELGENDEGPTCSVHGGLTE